MRAANQIQRFLVEETRLGIPAIFHNEALNGVMAPGFTVFPTAIGLAAAWDPQAVERMAVLIGRQMRAIGMRQALAPVLDVARDARWGRVHETYGEDPYLVSALGVAYVRGLQSQDVIATAKHFLGYAAGLDVELPEIAGYGPALAEAVKAGRIGEDMLDRSVRRVLRDKFALGLFENPYVEEDPVAIRRTAAEGAGLARELARKSVTLLKNEDGVLPLAPGVRKVAVIGPLADDVTAAFPTYTYPAMRRMLTRSAASAMPGTESVSDGSASSLAAQMAPATVLDGDAWIRAEYDALSLAEAVRKALPKAEVTSVIAAALPDGGTDDIPAAVTAARDADVVILALGGRAGWLPGGITEGEGHDSADIDLPAAQVRLVAEVAATATPAIAVIQAGRPPPTTSAPGASSRSPAARSPWTAAPISPRRRQSSSDPHRLLRTFSPVPNSF